ncbi:unnamed protein product [Amoebophrya sp. A120]|nr:unnamed protein product [Amoebophrya sp. A120]|eukprot:GSA120T00010196001.1
MTAHPDTSPVGEMKSLPSSSAEGAVAKEEVADEQAQPVAPQKKPTVACMDFADFVDCSHAVADPATADDKDSAPSNKPKVSFFESFIMENTPVKITNLPIDEQLLKDKFNKKTLKHKYGAEKIQVAPQQVKAHGVDKWLERVEDWKSVDVEEVLEKQAGCNYNADQEQNQNENCKKRIKVLAVAARRTEMSFADFLNSLPHFYADGAGCLDRCFGFLKANELEDEELVVRTCDAGRPRRPAGAATSTSPASRPLSHVLEKQLLNNVPLDVKNHDIWLGQGTKSRLHYDNQENFFLQLSGRKRIRLFPPLDAANLVEDDVILVKKFYKMVEAPDQAAPDEAGEAVVAKHQHDKNYQFQRDDVHDEAADPIITTNYATFDYEGAGTTATGETTTTSITSEEKTRIAKLRQYEDIYLNPGELLYIPVGWWHEIEAVAWNPASTCDADSRINHEDNHSSTADKEKPLNLSYTTFFYPFFVRLKDKSSRGRAAGSKLGTSSAHLASTWIPNPRYKHLHSGQAEQKPKHDVDDDDEELSKAKLLLQKKVMKKANEILDEHYVTNIVKLGCLKFLEKKLHCETECAKILRKWFLLRVNNQIWRHGCESRVLSSDMLPVERNFEVWPTFDEEIDRRRLVEEPSSQHAEMENTTATSGNESSGPAADSISEMKLKKLHQDLQDIYPKIREEVLQLRCSSGRSSDSKSTTGWQPYRDPKEISEVETASSAAPSAGEHQVEPETKTKLPGITATSSGQWNVFYLYLNHKAFEENLEKLPVTKKAIETIFPNHYSHAFVSALVPGTKIIPHFGPSNRMLRVWLPLDGCNLDPEVEPQADSAAREVEEGDEYVLEETRALGTKVWRSKNGRKVGTSTVSASTSSTTATGTTAGEDGAVENKSLCDIEEREKQLFPIALQVGNKIIQPRNGEPFIWDHSYYHSAWNFGRTTRLVLIVDIWHPELSDGEIRFFSALQQAKLRYGRRLLQELERRSEEKGSEEVENEDGSGVLPVDEAVRKQYRESNFISLVEETKGILTDDDWWVIQEEQARENAG